MEKVGKKRFMLTMLVGLVLSGFAFAQKGGDLVIAMNGSSEPASLDGQIDPYQSAWLIDSLASDRLVFVNPDTAAYEPFLATGWETSDDGLSWTFTLRDDVMFQDGTPFNAEALQYNLERIKAPETASAQAADELGPITALEVVDEYTLKLTYEQPWSNLLDAFTSIPIWSPAALAQYPPGEFDQHLVGTGPFKLVEWVPNSFVRFEKWDEYDWGPSIKTEAGPVYLDSVTFRFIDEEVVRGTIITTDEANVVWELPTQYVVDYRDNPDYQLLTGYQAGTGLQYVMNVTRAPLDNLKVRQAIRHAVSSEGLNNLVYDGLNLEVYGALNSVHPCYNEAVADDYPYDLDKAAQLLAEAGYEDRDGDGIVEAYGVEGMAEGEPLNITWTALSRESLGEAIQAQLRMVGIDMDLEIVPGPVQLEKAQSKDFDLMYERQRSPTPSVLHQVWFSGNDRPGGWAWTGFADAALDELLEDIQVTLDPEASCDLAKEAQQIISNNAVQLPTVSEAVFYVLDSNVEDFQLGTEGNWFYLYNTYIE